MIALVASSIQPSPCAACVALRCRFESSIVFRSSRLTRSLAELAVRLYPRIVRAAATRKAPRLLMVVNAAPIGRVIITRVSLAVGETEQRNDEDGAMADRFGPGLASHRSVMASAQQAWARPGARPSGVRTRRRALLRPDHDLPGDKSRAVLAPLVVESIGGSGRRHSTFRVALNPRIAESFGQSSLELLPARVSRCTTSCA